MNIKKTRILPVLMLVFLLAGCGSSEKLNSSTVQDSFMVTGNSSIKGGSSYENGVSMDYSFEGSAMAKSSTESSSEATLNGAKLIRNVNVSLETTELESVVEEFENRTSEYGGYIQDVNLRTSLNNRYYDMVIRIPYDKVDNFMEGIDELAIIKNIRDTTEDITLQYADSATRLKNLNQQHSRLLDLLDKAENLTDIIEIEARLSEVETEIDSYTLEIKNYDNLVNYSIISIEIYEKDYVSVNVDNSLFGRIKSGLSDNLHQIKEEFLDLVVWIVVHIPNIVIWVAVIAVVVLVIKKIKKKPINFLKKFKKKNEK